MSSIILYGITISLFLLSFFKDREKTKKALRKGYKSFVKLLSALLPMMLFIGISLSLIKPELISKLIGSESGFYGVFLSLSLGSAAFLPGFVAFPLGANLLAHGGGYPQIAGFISSLMGVGLVSLPVEIKYFGKKAALLRNTLGLLSSIAFVIIIWGAMK